MPTVLLVDDEPQIRSLLASYFRADGFTVVEAGTSRQARDRFAAGVPDLVLLDIGLPDGDGLGLLSEFRHSSDVYVMLVTARAEEVDKLVGLSVGADDYITKPFSPREVVARAKAVLRRTRGLAAASESHEHRFDGLRIDRDRRELQVDDEPIELSALEFDLLWALADAPGRVFSRAQLLEKVWGYDFFGDERVVDVHVRSLRKALSDDAGQPRFIGTVRGVGYKFLPRESS